MKHKIQIVFGGKMEEVVESFCESVGFDNVIRIMPFGGDIDTFAIMIH